MLQRKLGKKSLERVSATTTTDVPPGKEGDLLILARRLGVPVLGLAKSVGGRFSVLTPVGFVPGAFLGIDMKKVVDGARAMRKHCWSAPPTSNVGILGAVLLHMMATTRARPIQVLMPYADALVHLVDWYRQLWAESLGKRVTRNGGKAETGQTPVLALGATDQHSQVQLYMEGPHDKVVTFLEVDRFRKEIRVPRRHQDLSSTGYLGGRTLGELINNEKRGTEIALTKGGRPNFTYHLPMITPHVLGHTTSPVCWAGRSRPTPSWRGPATRNRQRRSAASWRGRERASRTMATERRTSGLLRVPFVQVCRLELSGGRSLTGFVVNINIMGAYVAAEQADFPALGEAVVCRFRTPENDIEMEIQGTVAWLNAHQPHPVHSLPPGLGVKFSPLRPEYLDRIKTIVDGYVKRHPGVR
jgi:hypothetical protein